MVKTIGDLVKEVVSTFGPRDDLGIEGYKTFVGETKNIDDFNVLNKISYGSILGHTKSNFNEIIDVKKYDIKRDIALYRMNRVDELKEESTKYLTKLDRIVEDCTIERFDLNSEISEVNKRLSPLVEDYNNMKANNVSMRKKALSGRNKVMNVFYFVFNKNKIKEVDKLNKEDNALLKYNIRSNMAEIKINEAEVKYDTEILKIKTEKMKSLELKRNVAKKEISKIVDFNSRTESMKNFYKKYLDSFSDSQDTFDGFKKTEKENVFVLDF